VPRFLIEELAQHVEGKSPDDLVFSGIASATDWTTSPTAWIRRSLLMCTRCVPGRMLSISTTSADGLQASNPGPLAVCPRQDSNLRHRLRRAVLYPLSYGGGKPSKPSSGAGSDQDVGGGSGTPPSLRSVCSSDTISPDCAAIIDRARVRT
jgi:hypothetical protein